MRVGIDLDGVVYPFVAALRARIINALHVRRPLHEPTNWEFWHEWGLTFEEWKAFFDAGVEDGTLFSHGGPLDHGTINKIHDLHSVHIITHRPPAAHGTTRAWLRSHAIRFDSLTFSEDKTVVPTDIFLDDRVENVEKVNAAGTVGVLFDQGWNRHAPADMLRVHSWREFRDMVKEIGG